MSNALSGLRILDLSDRSTALGGRILADLGAEVILVEAEIGNPIRHLAPFLDDVPGVAVGPGDFTAAIIGVIGVPGFAFGKFVGGGDGGDGHYRWRIHDPGRYTERLSTVI